MSSITLDFLSSALHSVEIKNAAGTALALDASGFVTSNINGTVTVSASDLDIRDLSSATDSISAVQSGTWTVGVSGNVNVTASDLDIRNLAYATDSVTAYQGGNWSIENVPAGFANWKVSAASVTNSESEIASTPLTGRLSILIQNLGAVDVYLKEATGVLPANGMLLPKGSSFSAELDSGANIFAITASGTANLRVVEYAL